MGKTPSRASSSAVVSKRTTTPINSIKRTMSFKKKQQKSSRKMSIVKLFNRLRDKSTDTISVINDDSVIILDDISQKHSNASQVTNMNESSVIFVNNEVDESITTPGKKPKVICSTPRTREEISIDLDFSNVSKNVPRDVLDLTKEVNDDSYITIDLTMESNNTSSEPVTIIDIDQENPAQKNNYVSFCNSSLSGESDVTVLNKTQHQKKNIQMKKFAREIKKMNSSDKGRLLELITAQILNGCGSMTSSSSMTKLKQRITRGTGAEDTYIKEVILGQQPSRNSIGSNIYNPQKEIKTKSGLRMIVIDGSNVAMHHTKGKCFSVLGLKICIEYFVHRGHIVKAFVPHFRCKFGKSSDPRLLDSLERQGLVIYTPSREVQGRCIASYDDRYIVQCAAEFDGVIVSKDNYRDLLDENARFRAVIETRLLPFTWVDDMIMFPRDPLGRNGPTLEAFLRHST